jgi:hypothetical protein
MSLGELGFQKYKKELVDFLEIQVRHSEQMPQQQLQKDKTGSPQKLFPITRKLLETFIR